MGFWGKIVGGAAGFALGGPLGALLGGLAGHAVDKLREDVGDEAEGTVDGALPLDDSARQIAFTIAVVVLGAKLAKADGAVSRVEVDAFKRVFRVQPEQVGRVARVFDRAKADAGGFEPYARQVARLYRANPRVLQDLLNGLFHIAKADGHVNPRELEYLRQVGEIFGFGREEFETLRAPHMADGPAEDDAYRILGVDPGVSDEELKRAWRRLIRENHPDALAAQGLPPELLEVAGRRLAAINDAYRQARKLRGRR